MSDSRKWFLFALLAGIGYLLHLLAPVLVPFVTGALLAYLGDPLADRLEAAGLSRTLAVVVVFLVILLALLALPLILLPALEAQVTRLVEALPRYLAWVQQHVLPWLGTSLGVDLSGLDWSTLEQALQTHWRNVGGVAAAVVKTVSQSGMAMLGWLANLVLVPVVTFYLLRDWDVLMARIRSLLPRRLEPAVVELARQSDEVLGAFLRGQLMVMLGLATVYSAGLWLVGLDLGLLLGSIAGLVIFVPYLGFILGIVLAGVAAVMQFHDVIHLVYVLAVFAVGQTLESVFFTPLFVGDKIGLHPVAVIFAVMAGGQLYGFIGVLLALPVAAVVVVLLRYVHRRYTESDLYTAR